MIKLRILFTLFIGIAIGFYGCTDEDDMGDEGNNGTNPLNDPTIKVTDAPDKYVTLKDSITFKLVLQASSTSARLTQAEMEVMKKTGGKFESLPSYYSSKYIAGLNKTGKIFGFRISNDDFNEYDSIKVKFTLSESTQKTVTETKTLIVGKLLTDRLFVGTDSTIQLNHRFTSANPPNNKFSLYYSATNDKIGYVEGPNTEGDTADIMDYSATDSTFERRWRSMTSTEFVKVNPDEINFTYPFSLNVEDAYARGNPSGMVRNLAQGDIIIANVRQEGKFIVIKITNVNENQSSAAQSFIEFKATGADIY